LNFHLARFETVDEIHFPGLEMKTRLGGGLARRDHFELAQFGEANNREIDELNSGFAQLACAEPVVMRERLPKSSCIPISCRRSGEIHLALFALKFRKWRWSLPQGVTSKQQE
jgi:hypothetical protein